MKNLSIRIKLLSVVAFFAVGFLGFLGIFWMKTAETLEDSDYAHVVEMKDFTADVLPPPLYTLEAYSTALDLAAGSMEKAEVSRRIETLQELEKAFRDRKGYWNEHLSPGPMLDAVNGAAAKTAAEVFEIIGRDVIPAAQGAPTALPAAIAKLRTAYAGHRAAIDDLVRQGDTMTRNRVSEAAGAIHIRKVELLAFGLAMTAVSVLFGFFLARAVGRRLASAASLLARVADGDFRPRMEADSGDEIGQMGRGLNAALDSIDGAFQEVRETAGRLTGAANVLASSSEEISSGAQQQAASLEETAASLEEITATVKQSAGNALQASQLATNSREVAEAGGKVVSEAVHAMNEVSQASRRIGDIISTIDEIALQTNLLALNAAVEAARAGEQGRGFAVVAAEVGNLAQRSATAAKEVKTLIHDTLQRVEAGNSLVGESGRALGEIITSVKKVTDIFGEIAAAAREQSAGVDQVNEAIAQMDRVTQGNASQTSELSNTAEGLSRQATMLDELLERFQLSTKPASAPVPRPAPRPSKPAKSRATTRRGTYDDGRDRGESVEHGLNRTAGAHVLVAPAGDEDDQFEVV